MQQVFLMLINLLFNLDYCSSKITGYFILNEIDQICDNKEKSPVGR